MISGADTRRPIGRGVKVVLVGPVPSSGLCEIRQYARKRCSFEVYEKHTASAELLRKLKDADVAVCQYFTDEMIQAAPKLRLLHAVGAGVDTFAMDKLPRTTTVANVYFHAPAIAEYVMMVILALSRNLIQLDAQLRRGNWQGSWITNHPPYEEICGKTLGVIGLGHIGKEVVRKAKAFRMFTQAVTPRSLSRLPRSLDQIGGMDDLRNFLSSVDFLIISCPCNESTIGLIGRRQLEWMKSSAFLINVSRGPIVQERALYECLKNHRIRGAAIDVWYTYPHNSRPTLPSKYPIELLENVLMTPHISGWTRGTLDHRFKFIACNIDRFVSGRPIENVVQGPRINRTFGPELSL